MSYPGRLLVKGIEISAAAPNSATVKPITGGPFSAVVGIGDVNADQEQDLILQNPATKQICHRYFRRDLPGHLSFVLRTIPTARIVGQIYLYEFRGTSSEVGLLLDSSAGISSRQWWYLHAGDFGFSVPIEGADAYNSWDAVAVVTDR